MEIRYSKPAIKKNKKQDKPTQQRILKAIEKLPFEGDIKKMQGIEIHYLSPFLRAQAPRLSSKNTRVISPTSSYPAPRINA